jgi:L-asparaginase
MILFDEFGVGCTESICFCAVCLTSINQPGLCVWNWKVWVMSKVRIINTGGTISMRPSDDGYFPQAGFVAEEMSKMEELTLAPMPEYDICQFDPLIDSSNMTPATWLKIATEIEQHYDQYDGFVILHGTDTLAYTASALAFMLQQLSKPVILTGSQLPLGQLRSDARENLKTAMVLAANYSIPEVGLFFDDRLLRGCRSCKVSATRFNAFDSPNYPPLAYAGTKIEVIQQNIRDVSQSSGPLNVCEIRRGEIASFRLFPGFSVDVLQSILSKPLKALILETYGDGNGPAANSRFLKVVQTAVEQGIVVVGCTQCLHGGTTQSDYATGRALARAGVISTRDMTIEAVFAKLLYLLSSDHNVNEIRRIVGKNLVGELTEAGAD